MPSVIQPGLFMVIERFPENRAAFKRLYAGDEGFQSLCESYQQCSEAIRYWSKSKQVIAPDRNREYKKLLHELEMEILDYRPDDRPTESGI